MSSKVTLKDIARELNISIGTVDRAIHDRGRVDPETSKAIMEKIEELGYKPNSIARALRKNGDVKVGVVLPLHNYFFNTILAGIQAAQKELSDYPVEYSILSQDSEDDPITQLNQFKQLIEENVSAIVVSPVHSLLLNSQIDEAVKKGIPVITINTDAKDSLRTCYIGQDSYHTGGVVASIFGKFLRHTGRIVILKAGTDSINIKMRLDGFCDKLKADYPDIEIAGTYDYTNKIEVAREIAKIILQGDRPPEGIFVNTSFGAIGVGTAIRELGLNQKVITVGYDTQKDIKMLLDDDSIFATVTQNPFFQGYHAIKMANRIIFENYRPEEEKLFTYTGILVNSTQVDLYEKNFWI